MWCLKQELGGGKLTLHPTLNDLKKKNPLEGEEWCLRNDQMKGAESEAEKDI